VTVYSAPAPAERSRGGANVLARIAPNVRSDPREELRNMTLRDEARAILQKRVSEVGTLVDESAPDPYDDSADPLTRSFTLLKAANGETVLLHVPEWIANDGRQLGALDETRYAFRGKVVRIIAPGVDAPSLGLENLIGNWKTLEKIDAGFVPWRYVRELGEGKHRLDQVLKIALSPVVPPPPPPPPVPLVPKVFVSYAHEDVGWHDKLLMQLAPLRDRYGQAVWTDHQLAAGDDWMAKLVEALQSSQVVILLVSPAFIASPFIKQHEFSVALKEAEAGNKLLLWVFVTTCPYESVGIGKYQAAHDIERALDQLADGDAWAQLKKVHDNLATALAKLLEPKPGT
jgi:TIR domain